MLVLVRLMSILFCQVLAVARRLRSSNAYKLYLQIVHTKRVLSTLEITDLSVGVHTLNLWRV